MSGKEVILVQRVNSLLSDVQVRTATVPATGGSDEWWLCHRLAWRQRHRLRLLALHLLSQRLQRSSNGILIVKSTSVTVHD